MTAKYKDAQGRYRTISLFKETITASAKAAGYTPVFTLKDEDTDTGLPSLKRLFIESDDPTGYTTAIDALGSWDHWVKLFNNKQFYEELEEWKIEQDVRIQSKAIAALREVALNEGARGVQAAKYLADKGWMPSKRGRPSKDEKEGIRRQEARLARELTEDEDRVAHLVKR